MESKGNNSLTGIPRWACPWTAEVSGMHTNSHAAAETGLPKNSQRRLQRIGFAATGIAASVWLMAVVWVWEIVRS